MKNITKMYILIISPEDLLIFSKILKKINGQNFLWCMLSKIAK